MDLKASHLELDPEPNIAKPSKEGGLYTDPKSNWPSRDCYYDMLPLQRECSSDSKLKSVHESQNVKTDTVPKFEEYFDILLPQRPKENLKSQAQIPGGTECTNEDTNKPADQVCIPEEGSLHSNHNHSEDQVYSDDRLSEVSSLDSGLSLFGESRTNSIGGSERNSYLSTNSQSARVSPIYENYTPSMNKSRSLTASPVDLCPLPPKSHPSKTDFEEWTLKKDRNTKKSASMKTLPQSTSNDLDLLRPTSAITISTSSETAVMQSKGNIVQTKDKRYFNIDHLTGYVDTSTMPLPTTTPSAIATSTSGIATSTSGIATSSGTTTGSVNSRYCNLDVSNGLVAVTQSPKKTTSGEHTPPSPATATQEEVDGGANSPRLRKLPFSSPSLVKPSSDSSSSAEKSRPSSTAKGSVSNTKQTLKRLSLQTCGNFTPKASSSMVYENFTPKVSSEMVYENFQPGMGISQEPAPRQNNRSPRLLNVSDKQQSTTPSSPLVTPLKDKDGNESQFALFSFVKKDSAKERPRSMHRRAKSMDNILEGSQESYKRDNIEITAPPSYENFVPTGRQRSFAQTERRADSFSKWRSRSREDILALKEISQPSPKAKRLSSQSSGLCFNSRVSTHSRDSSHSSDTPPRAELNYVKVHLNDSPELSSKTSVRNRSSGKPESSGRIIGKERLAERVEYTEINIVATNAVDSTLRQHHIERERKGRSAITHSTLPTDPSRAKGSPKVPKKPVSWYSKRSTGSML